MRTGFYQSVDSPDARTSLRLHYDTSDGLYLFLADWMTILRTLFLGPHRGHHPGHLHHMWDFRTDASIDRAVCRTVREALRYLSLNDISSPLLLDAGCGTGGCALQIARECPSHRIIGYSLVAKQIETARRCARYARFSRVRFLVGNHLRIPLQAACVDGIYAVETLCHVPEREKCQALSEFYRVLAPGRRLVVFDGYTKKFITTPDHRRLYEQFLSGWTLPYLSSASFLSDCAEEAGFRTVGRMDATCHVRDGIAVSSRRARRFLPFIRSLHSFMKFPALGTLIHRIFQRTGLSSDFAAAFCRACVAEKTLVDHNLLGYFVHVFEKPSRF